MSRNIDISINEFYHLYNRGVDKRVVFMDTEDYERFVALLYMANTNIPVHISNYQGLTLIELLALERGETLVDIGAYCLMPNHFHVLVREKVENGISIYMHKVMTGYTMYFNKKYMRTGSLFGGTFKAQHVYREEHLKYLFAYIHLNPIKIIDSKWKKNGIIDKKKAEAYLREYRYSSYIDYSAQAREEGIILNHSAFPGYFDTAVAFKSFVSWWLSFESIANIKA